MKAVILPAANVELLSPICNWTSDYMIPVVNKPVAEHMIELLLSNDIRDFIFLLNHNPHETEKYFGMGERWGCNITYQLIMDNDGIISALSKIQNRLNEPFLCMPVNMITNLDISSFADHHNENNGDMTVAVSETGTGFSEIKRYPFIMNPETLAGLTEADKNMSQKKIIDYMSKKGSKVLYYRDKFDIRSIRTLNDYQGISRAVLKGEIKGINIPGKQVRKGLWVGRQTFIHPEAKILPPLLIGANCNIRREATVGDCSVIGNDVIVDSESEVKRSIIYDSTYVGINTEIKDSIARKNFIFNLPYMSNLYVDDDSILGNMDKTIFLKKAKAVYNSAAASLLFLFFSPLILILYLYHLLFPSKNYLCIKERYGGYSSVNMQGEPEIEKIQRYCFNSSSSLIRKLPGLINVIKGDLRLVGNSPLTKEEVESITEEWQKVRFEAPAGLIHLWETEKSLCISWEDKIISESFYASTRSFRGDVAILLKFLFQIRDRKAEEHSEALSV